MSKCCSTQLNWPWGRLSPRQIKLVDLVNLTTKQKQWHHTISHALPTLLAAVA